LNRNVFEKSKDFLSLGFCDLFRLRIPLFFYINIALVKEINETNNKIINDQNDKEEEDVEI